MKLHRSVLVSLLLLVLVASLYRVIPGRPYGFAPQWAMAVFAGAVLKDRRWAFLLPVLSMFLSDLFYQVLYVKGLSSIPGFYQGQWQNYVLFALMTFVGFAVKNLRVTSLVLASLAAPTLYFFLSNFWIWASATGNRGLGRPHTFSGLMQCYVDGLPFYRMSVVATLVFSTLLFGSYFLLTHRRTQWARP